MQIVLMLTYCIICPFHQFTFLLSHFFHQIQDARNHVNQALQLLNSRDESYCFKTGAEVNKVCHYLAEHGQIPIFTVSLTVTSVFLLVL